MLDYSSLLQIRDKPELSHLKAVVQYKGKLSKKYSTKEYRNVRVYEVTFTLLQPYNSYSRWSSSHDQPVLLL